MARCACASGFEDFPTDIRLHITRILNRDLFYRRRVWLETHLRFFSTTPFLEDCCYAIPVPIGLLVHCTALNIRSLKKARSHSSELVVKETRIEDGFIR